MRLVRRIFCMMLVGICMVGLCQAKKKEKAGNPTYDVSIDDVRTLDAVIRLLEGKKQDELTARLSGVKIISVEELTNPYDDSKGRFAIVCEPGTPDKTANIDVTKFFYNNPLFEKNMQADDLYDVTFTCTVKTPVSKAKSKISKAASTVTFGLINSKDEEAYQQLVAKDIVKVGTAGTNPTSPNTSEQKAKDAENKVVSDTARASSGNGAKVTGGTATTQAENSKTEADKGSTGTTSSEPVSVMKDGIPVPPKGYVLINIEQRNIKNVESVDSFQMSTFARRGKTNISSINSADYIVWNGEKWIESYKLVGYSCDKYTVKDGYVATKDGYFSDFTTNYTSVYKPAYIIALNISQFIPEEFDESKDKLLYDVIANNFWIFFQFGSYRNGPCLEQGSFVPGVMKELSKSYKNEQYAYSLTPNGKIQINAYLGKPNVENLVIPEKIEGIEVSKIAFIGSYDSEEGIKCVTIPKTVEVIGDYAFWCTGLDRLVFKDGSKLKSIGIGAFSYNHLKEISIPLNSGLNIYKGAFYDNEIKKISIFKGWTIGPLIAGSDFLEEVVFMEGCTEVAAGSFKDCKNLKKITLPKTIKGIYESAFENCTSLSEVILPDTLYISNLVESGTDIWGSTQYKHYSDAKAFHNCPLSLKTKSALLKAGLSEKAFE